MFLLEVEPKFSQYGGTVKLVSNRKINFNYLKATSFHATLNYFMLCCTNSSNKSLSAGCVNKQLFAKEFESAVFTVCFWPKFSLCMCVIFVFKVMSQFS